MAGNDDRSTQTKFKTRIQLKHDTEENWLKATTFKPFKGELIIYDVDSTHSVPRFKVGDGVKVVGDLPFADKDFAKLGDINAVITASSFNANGGGILESYYYPDEIQFVDGDGKHDLFFPSKSGTLALTSDIISSFNNFTLLTSKPSDWATNYDTYYKKGDFGFFRNVGDSTWAANKFYSASPAEIDIQTSAQPIKIQASGTNAWGEYGGLNLSYGKAKLYGINGEMSDTVGYIDISNGNLTSAVYNADFTLSNPVGRGYGFSVKDTSTLFSVGLNKSQAGDYAEQYYCNINAPLNVTQIHGFTQLTDQPSDWSTKYDSYYVGFDAFNGNSRFWGRSDGLYKPTNDILLNVGTGHKIKIAGLYGSLGTDEIRNSITLSNSGINLKHEITGATSTLDILPSNININSGALKLSASNDAGYIELGAVGNINLKGNYPITITSDADKVYGSNMFKLTVSGQNAIGVDTFSTSSNNLIRFEMTPKFNTNKIRGMAGNDLTLPGSSGTLAHIPAGTTASSMLFGDNTWGTPVTINGNTFKSMAGDSIYAPTSTPSFSSNAQNYGATAFCTFIKGQTAPTFLDPSSLVNRYVLQTHTKIGNATEVSWTINYGLKANFTSFTIGTSHKDGRRVMKTCNVTDFIYKIDSAYVDVTGASSNFQFRITNMGTSSTTFGIKNNSYNNLTGEWFIVFHYVF